MRPIAFKILLALVFGLVSPLCCCTAMALAGSACGDEAIATKDETCVRSCCGGERRANESAPAEQGRCPKCPKCTSNPTASPDAGSRLISKDQIGTPVVMIALVAILEMSHPTDSVGPRLPTWLHDPPSIKANRDALRWHCALIV